jgi:hypothetical protein
MIGARIDARRGDMLGMQRNMMDLVSGMPSGSMDMMFGTGLPPFGFVPRPHMMMPHLAAMYGGGYYNPMMGSPVMGGMAIANSMSMAMMGATGFAATLGGLVGGIPIADGRTDGRLSVLRYTPMFAGMALTAGAFGGNPLMGGVFRGAALMQMNMGRVMGGMLMPGFNMMGASLDMVLHDPETRNTAHECGMKPPLSFEDVLFLLMIKYAKKKEKEILKKVNELTGKGTGGAAGRMATRASGIGAGLFGGIARFFGHGMADVENKNAMGPQNTAYDPMDPNKSDSTKQAMLQKMMNDLQKVYTLLTNVIKSMFDMQMSIVRNTR